MQKLIYKYMKYKFIFFILSFYIYNYASACESALDSVDQSYYQMYLKNKESTWLAKVIIEESKKEDSLMSPCMSNWKIKSKITNIIKGKTNLSEVVVNFSEPGINNFLSKVENYIVAFNESTKVVSMIKISNEASLDLIFLNTLVKNRSENFLTDIKHAVYTSIKKSKTFNRCFPTSKVDVSDCIVKSKSGSIAKYFFYAIWSEKNKNKLPTYCSKHLKPDHFNVCIANVAYRLAWENANTDNFCKKYEGQTLEECKLAASLSLAQKKS